MNREELILKLSRDETLTPLECALLEAYLEEGSVTASILGSISDDEPSLKWRAQLNERLGKIAPTRRSRWQWRLALGGFATAVASVAIFFVVSSQSSASNSQTDIGQELIQWHQETVASNNAKAHAHKASGSELFDESVSSL